MGRNRIRLESGGVNVELHLEDVAISNVIVDVWEIGGDGSRPQGTTNAPGKNQFSGLVAVTYHSHKGIRQVGVVVNNGEFSARADDPAVGEWADLIADQSGLSGNLGCGPEGCPPNAS